MTHDEIRAYNERDARVTFSLLEQARVIRERELFRARVMLCDLMHGRSMRERAARELGVALELEAHGAPAEAVTASLEVAAHWEWIASITEKGQVLWGERRNRDGVTAEDAERERSSS